MPNWPLVLLNLLLLVLQLTKCQPFFERAPASRISWASNFTTGQPARSLGHPEDLFETPGLTLELPASAFEDFTSTFFGRGSNNQPEIQPSRRREPISFRPPFENFNAQPFLNNNPSNNINFNNNPSPPVNNRRNSNFNGNGNGNSFNNNNFNDNFNNRPINRGPTSVARSFEQPPPWSQPPRRPQPPQLQPQPLQRPPPPPPPPPASSQPQPRRLNQPVSPNTRLQGEPGFVRNTNLAPSAPSFSSSSSSSSLNLVPSSCLSCLCVASTGCDLKKQCVGEFCGPFLISWPYWSDAGKPGGDYVKCALNRECAEAAVQGYMKKWTRDCNGDGVVDCDDFAAIHKLGPHMCREDSVSSTPYWSAYESCSARSSRSNSNSNLPSSNSFLDERNSPRVNPPVNGIRGRGRSNSDFSLGTTARPAIDLPLITPRRRLTSNRQGENPDGSPSTITRNFVESSANGLAPPGRNVSAGASVGDNSDRNAITKECFECICEASSGCERDMRCNSPDRDTQLCGAYQLDRSYWRLAGRPGFAGSLNDFESCASDPRCAEETVSRFMKRMSFDCNEDGVVDCLDYAAIHKAGVKHCNSQWFLESKYWSQFEQCYGFSR